MFRQHFTSKKKKKVWHFISLIFKTLENLMHHTQWKSKINCNQKMYLSAEHMLSRCTAVLVNVMRAQTSRMWWFFCLLVMCWKIITYKHIQRNKYKHFDKIKTLKACQWSTVIYLYKYSFKHLNGFLHNVILGCDHKSKSICWPISLRFFVCVEHECPLGGDKRSHHSNTKAP